MADLQIQTVDGANRSLNTYSAILSTNTTTNITSATAYISCVTIAIVSAGTTSTVTVQDKQTTPVILLNLVPTTTLSAGDTLFNFQTPQKMVSGISIVTAGAAAATIHVFVSYYQ